MEGTLKMRNKIISRLLLGSLLFLAFGLPASAQNLPGEVVVNDLVNPRGIFLDAEGSLYVVEAGNGSPDRMAVGPFGPTPIGTNGQVVRVRPDGTREALLEGFIAENQGDTRGAQAIQVTEGSYWVLLGEGPLSFPFNMGLVEIERQNNRILRFVDLYTTAAAQHVIENPSNPTDFAMTDDGTFFIANAGCNCVQRWKAGEGTTIFAAWDNEDNPVPTAVELGIDGFLYIGFLTGFPFPEGGSRIEIWSVEGELVDTIEGLTTVVDILVDDMGTIYATEFGVFGDQGFGPGRVVMVTEDGLTPVVENLPAPWGLALDGEGSLLVSVNSAGGVGGAVIRVPLPEM